MQQANIEELIKEAVEKLHRASRVVVLTGAGVSAECGIATFRDAQTGLWEQFNPQELASPDGFRDNPKLVWDWYEYRREIVRSSSPNPAHFTLAALEDRFEKFLLVTQNVDELHKRAGSRNVVELHGRILENRCFEEDRLVADEELDLDITPPRCPCGSYVRPGVVWFGEAIPSAPLAEAFAAARRCEVCLVIGTSGVVQPAASIPMLALRAGACIIEVNSEESAITDISHIFLRGKAGVILPEIKKLS